jgi:hypothetical protein
VLLGVTVGGVLLERPGWVIGCFAAVVVVSVFAEGAYRLWAMSEDARSRDMSDHMLRMHCAVVGAGIQVFVDERESQKPTPASIEEAMGLTELTQQQRIDRVLAVVDWEHAHKTLYEREFAAEVYELVRQLRRNGHIEPAEAERLNFPADLDGIRYTGDRLYDYSKRLAGGLRSA